MDVQSSSSGQAAAQSLMNNQVQMRNRQLEQNNRGNEPTVTVTSHPDRREESSQTLRSQQARNVQQMRAVEETQNAERSRMQAAPQQTKGAEAAGRGSVNAQGQRVGTIINTFA